MSRKASDVLQDALKVVVATQSRQLRAKEYAKSLATRSLAMELHLLFDNEIEHEGDPNERTRAVSTDCDPT